MLSLIPGNQLAELILSSIYFRGIRRQSDVAACVVRIRELVADPFKSPLVWKFRLSPTSFHKLPPKAVDDPNEQAVIPHAPDQAIKLSLMLYPIQHKVFPFTVILFRQKLSTVQVFDQFQNQSVINV